jgi:prevent-host-death family protein
MNWRIAEAKQSFSRLINASRDEPQLIFNRSRLVAAVVEAETYKEFVDWRTRHRRLSVADGAAQVRQACAEEGYAFDLPTRKSRPNPFADALDDLPR